MSVILLPVWMVTVKTCSSDSRHCSISHIQIEQDMGMIVGKAYIPLLFEKAWVISYVPALLLFGERGRKKVVKNIFSRLVETGMYMYVYTCCLVK